MPLSTAAKAALCLCPPAVMAGTVAAVPAAKRAVHHLTAPRHAAKPVHRVATAAARPATARQAACDPVAAGPLPIAPLVTYAAPIPDEPVGGPAGGAGPGGPGGIGILAAQAPVAAGPVAAVSPAVPADSAAPVPAVPEPASWLMMIVGAGALGATIRRRRSAAAIAARAGTTAGATLWGVGGLVEAGDAAATMAVQSGVAKSALASAAGKAMLCVCPAAVVAGSVVAVPPLRHAVHAATVPAPASASPISVVPCDQPMPVPVSATAVKGFPDTVTTVAQPS